jgi:hypothetical protein
VHQGSKSVRAHAKLSALLVIHDYEWQGYVNGNEPVPEEWKLFPGPVFSHFWDHFFGSSSTTKDTITWMRSEYRADQQTRIPDQRLRPDIQDSFWSPSVFEDLRLGNWGFNHPIQQADVDQHFSIFSFILSIDRDATWPPRVPQDGIWIDEMQQLGRNLMWFLDLALTQPMGQAGSLFLTFSLLGEALLTQFEWLDQRGLRTQWNADAASRRRHAYFFLLSTHRLLAEMQRWFNLEQLVFYVTPQQPNFPCHGTIALDCQRSGLTREHLEPTSRMAGHDQEDVPREF